MSDERVLRPCPFCGGEVMRRDALWPSEGDRDAVIHVGPSDCPIQVFQDDTWGGSLYGRWNAGLDAFAASALTREVERRREAEAQRDRLAAELPLLRKQCEERQSVYSELIAECERWRATEARIAKQGEDAIREAARQQLIANSTPCPKCGADWGLVARCAADDCPSTEARLEIFRAAIDLEEPDASVDRQGGLPDV